MIRRMYTVAFFALCLTSWYELRAQTPQATISGIITDESGAVVPAAGVTAINNGTSQRTGTTTNDEGFYVLNALAVGEYIIEAEKQGFKKFVRQGLTLSTAATVPLDIKLSPGDLNETVTVSGETSLLQARTSEVSQTIESQVVQDLPLGDRRTMNLIQITGSAVFVNYDAGGKPNFSLSGGRTQSQNFLIDGGTAQNMRLGIGQIDVDPPVETVQEVKVLNNSFSAEYGGSAGGVIIATTKSGTNDLHGSLFEYLRNDALDAANFFAPIENGKKVKSPVRYNVFGGTIGGPVLLPRFGEGGPAVYNGRNKTFFFFAYEGARRTDGLIRNLTVPTAAQRQGDFATSLGAPLYRQANNTIGTTVTGNPILHSDGSAARAGQIYDPTVTRRITGNVVTGRYFPGNRVPLDRLDAVALRLLDFYPLPNRPLDASGGNNFGANYGRILNRNNFTVKINHNFTDRDRLDFRYLYNSDNLGFTSVFPNPAADTLAPALRHQNYFYGAYTRVISPTIINEFRYTYADRINHEQSFGLGGDWPAQLGLGGVPNGAFPQINVTGVTSLGAGTHERRQFPIRQHQVVDNVSITRGRHSIKFGGEWRPSFNYEVNRPSLSGQFGFSPLGTGLPGIAATGSGFASLLLGFVNNFTLRETEVLDRSSHYLAAFVQDDWTVSPKLTLNLGLRWETDTPIKDKNNRMNSFDLDAINPVSGTPGVVRFVGVGGQPELPYSTDWNNFGPRIGFAYRPFSSGQTIIRGGFGIFFAHPFDHGAPSSAALGFERSLNLNSPDNGVTAPFLLRNGVPTADLSSSTRDDRFGAVRVGQPTTTAVTFFERDRATGYSQQFNLGIQHELPGTILVEASYIGNLSRKLPSASISLNQIAPGRVGATQQQSLRPFPQFTNVTLLFPTFGVSNYHAGVLRAEKRFTHGFNFLTTYTWAKFLNNTDEGGAALGDTDLYSDYYNRQYDYGPSANDIRHRFTISSVYELPVGSGKRFLSSSAAGKIFSGLSLGLLANIQSGPPVTVTTQVNTTNAFSAGGQRADLIGDPDLPTSERTTERWFNTNAFAQPSSGRFGTSGRSILRGDGRINFDLSLLKNITFSESRRLQLRAEAINAFNHPNFGLPGSTLGGPGFGVVNSAEPGRRLQLGVRFVF
ncbi:MAG TPA: carboxypeptidase regulatory-like domain-containing protein [Pyrinomonadaceae bacterium]|nr:carboxypeptidase regulatory-like domain-containing protein [Pyrinomonadaceae bacterium]